MNIQTNRHGNFATPSYSNGVKPVFSIPILKTSSEDDIAKLYYNRADPIGTEKKLMGGLLTTEDVTNASLRRDTIYGL